MLENIQRAIEVVLKKQEEYVHNLINSDSNLNKYQSLNIREVLFKDYLNNANLAKNNLALDIKDLELSIDNILHNIINYDFKFQLHSVEHSKIYLKNHNKDEFFRNELSFQEVAFLNHRNGSLQYQYYSEKYDTDQFKMDKDRLKNMVIANRVTSILSQMSERKNVMKNINIANQELAIIEKMFFGYVIKKQTLEIDEKFPEITINLLEDNYEKLNELSNFFSILNDKTFNISIYKEEKLNNKLNNKIK